MLNPRDFSFKIKDEDNFWTTINPEYIIADEIKEVTKDCFLIKIPNGRPIMQKGMKNSKYKII